jgi:hypothetical protein
MPALFPPCRSRHWAYQASHQLTSLPVHVLTREGISPHGSQSRSLRESRVSKYVPAWDGNNSPQVVALAQRWYRLAGGTEPQCLWCSAVLRGGLPAPCTRPELNGSGRLFLCRLPNARLDQIAASRLPLLVRYLVTHWTSPAEQVLAVWGQCANAFEIRCLPVPATFALIIKGSNIDVS